MKYMLLVCGDDTADASDMAPVEPWVEELGVERGVRRHGHRLSLPAEAVTVRVRDGEVLRTDGPFAETKEYVAGYDILECASMEEAVEAAARHPVATIGAMEVRAFWEDEDAEGEIRRLDAELTAAARERDFDRAMADFDEAIRLRPDSALAYHHRGNAWSGKGEPARALADYEAAIRIDPNNLILKSTPNLRARAAIARGEELYAQGKYYDAVRQYQKALSIQPNRSLANFRMGEAFFQQKNYQAAANAFRESLATEIGRAHV